MAPRRTAARDLTRCEHDDAVLRGNAFYCRRCGKLEPCVLCSRHVADWESEKDIYFDDMHIALEKPVCSRCETIYLTRLFLRFIAHQAIWKDDRNKFLLQELVDLGLGSFGQIGELP